MRFVVIGAGGLAKEVVDLLSLLQHSVVACYQEADSRPAKGHVVTRLPIVDDLRDVEFDAAALAVGSPVSRERLFELLPESQWPVLVHPSASVSPHATLGPGTLAMQNVVVSADAVVGRGALLNVGTYVAHDCTVEAFCHLAPNTTLGGGSHIEQACDLGMGTVVLPNVRIGAGSRTGSGAVVHRDVPVARTVVGVPARELDR